MHDEAAEQCPGSGQRLVHLHWLNLFGCPECRYAMDPDEAYRIPGRTTPDHPIPKDHHAHPDSR
jgi:hypothetical protein